jgi:hypothetical protein
MKQLNDALAEIHAIRAQIALGSEFRGYGPVSVASTGALALVVACAEAHWRGDRESNFGVYLAIWSVTAMIALVLSGTETVLRARRVHGGFAEHMIYQAAEQFLPAVASGLLLTAVVVRFALAAEWLLPGLWQMLFGLGMFASARCLPRSIVLVGFWYLATGLVTIAALPSGGSISPWAMGIPFGIGQLLVAAVLQFGYESAHAQP